MIYKLLLTVLFRNLLILIVSYLSKYKGYGKILNSFELLEMFSEEGEVGRERWKVGRKLKGKGTREGSGKRNRMWKSEKGNIKKI